DLCERFQQEIQSLLRVDAGKEEQNAFRLLPAERAARVSVVRSAVRRQAEGKDDTFFAWEDLGQVASLGLGCRQQSGSARKVRSLEEVKPGPLLPRFLAPRPRSQHAVRGDDIWNPELAATPERANVMRLPQAVEVHDVRNGAQIQLVQTGIAPNAYA